jgi:hypothetical protein
MLFSLTIRFGSNSGDGARVPFYDLAGGNHHMADDWAKAAANNFKQQEGDFDSKVSRAKQEKDMLIQQSPLLWEELRQWLQLHIDEFNRTVGKEVLTAPLTSPNKLDVFAKSDRGQRHASIQFTEASHSVSAEVRDVGRAYPPTQLLYPMKVTTENTLVFMNSRGGYESTTEDIGKDILNRLLAWPPQ